MKRDIRVLLVDDHEAIRQGLRYMLGQEDDMEIVGDYASAEEAVSKVSLLYPDIVLMDVRMPGMNGIEACRQMKGTWPACSVVILTMYEEYIGEAVAAGAASFLTKDVSREILAQTIRQIYWNQRKLEESDGLARIEEIELIMPPPVETAQLLKFIDRVKHTLPAEILRMIGSWGQGTTITVLLPKPTPLENVLDVLKGMPEVQEIGEEPLVRDLFPDFVKKIAPRQRVKTTPRKRILAILRPVNTPISEGQAETYTPSV